ncbi:MAG: threonine/serine dehydratase [Dehalococcoidia bacterium]|nr:threonine/serine dehydratase [Dehalococcoidia bacterium]
MNRPTLQDVLEARKTISPYVPRTPLHSYPALDQLLGATVRLKHENHQALGSFKVRGGVNLLAHMSEEERARGVVTASSGNHGQSIAYACRQFGAKAVICLPEGANPLKVRSMRNQGAEIVFHGKNFDESREHCARLADERGYRFVHAVNEPLLIAGVGTETLEIIEDFPEVDCIYVPLGGGSGAAGACVVAKAINPNIKVVAVQSAQAQGGYLSWRNRRLTESPMGTAAEGLATSTGYQMTQEILWDLLDDFILVDDDEMKEAIGILIDSAHTLAEAAGAASLAGAMKDQVNIKGKNVVVIVSGGNITIPQLRSVLDQYDRT